MRWQRILVGVVGLGLCGPQRVLADTSQPTANPATPPATAPVNQARDPLDQANPAAPKPQDQQKQGGQPQPPATTPPEPNQRVNQQGRPQTPIESTAPSPATPHAMEGSDLETIRTQAQRLLQYRDAATGAQREQLTQDLDRLAQSGQLLARYLSDPPTRLEAYHLSLQAYHALAKQATDHTQVKHWANRLKDTANNVKKIDSGAAAALSDFWLLIAEAIATEPIDPDPAARQRHAIASLQRFVDRHRQDQSESDGGVHPSILQAVRWGLLNLYDQRGDTDQATRLVAELRGSSPRKNKVARADLTDPSEAYTLLGQRFEAKLLTDDGGVWTSEAHLGMTVLLHFWSAWAPQSVEVFERLRSRYADLIGQGVAILSVRVDNPECREDMGHPPVGWATCWSQQGGLDLAEVFKVRAVPRLVLIDPTGHVAAVGRGLGILDRVAPPPALQESTAIQAQPDQPTRPAVDAINQTKPAPTTQPDQATPSVR